MARMLHPAERYAAQVLAGKIIVSRWTRLAVERQRRDLKDAHKRGLFFSPSHAQFAIDFFHWLRHSKGEWAGRQVVLEPWQQFNVWVLFGWRRVDGTRRFRTAYTEVPRKQGKSTQAAGTGLYMLVADGEPGAEVYTAATTRPQARIVHSEARRMVESSPMLRRRISVFRDNLSIPKTASKYEPLSSDYGTLDGLNPSCSVIDELHAHKDGGLVEKLRTAMGARRNPLLYYITTAGVASESIGYSEHNYARAVLEQVFDDDSYFTYIATIDDGDDPFAESTWRKANPNYGVSVKPTQLKESAERAERQAGMLNEFLRYHLNVWTAQTHRWMNLSDWDACRPLTGPNELLGEECYVGIDLAQTIDITAAAWLFPPSGERTAYTVIMQFWVPSDRVLDRVRKDRVPYDTWIREGLITATPGNVLDYDRVRADINDFGKRYAVKEIGYDPWGATQLALQLQGDGFICVPVRQGYRTLSEPTKFLEGAVLSKEIDHQGNAVLRWMASNVQIMTDPAGNIKPAKDKSIEKIDGIVALIAALSRAITQPDGKSIYETQPLRVI